MADRGEKNRRDFRTAINLLIFARGSQRNVRQWNLVYILARGNDENLGVFRKGYLRMENAHVSGVMFATVAI